MKVVMAPIELIGWFDEYGVINPIRFRFEDSDGERIVVKVGKIVKVEDEKLAGNHMRIFVCQSMIDGSQKNYELKYEIRTCRWFLFKI